MPDQIEFDDFDLSYEAYLTGRFPIARPGLDADDYYDAMLRELRKDPALFAHTGFGLVVERGWYEQNRPEFKVYPAIIEALQRTHVEIDALYFKMPFPTFMVRFPRHTFRESDDAPYVRAMIVTTKSEPIPHQQIVVDGAPMFITAPDDPVVDKFVIYVCFDAPGPANFNFFKFPLLPGQTIQRTFEETTQRSDGRAVKDTAEFDARGYWPSRGLYLKLLQIAVGVAFFAIGRDRQRRHNLVEEEALSRQERRRIAKATGGRTRDVRRPQFVVGREIELPRFESDQHEKAETNPDSTCASCEHPFSDHTKERKGCAHSEGDEPCECQQWDSGRHIAYGYIRSGHLHWYCVGKRKPDIAAGERNNYELRWVDPHAVRPDLPFGPPQARSIKPPKEGATIVSADITKLQNP